MAKKPRPNRAQRKAEERRLIEESDTAFEIEDTDFFSRDLLKTVLKIKDFEWTEKQREFIKLSLDDSLRIMFVSGPAGTSKTLMAVYSCLRLLSKKVVSDIAYIRSAVESSDAKLGFLPGSAEDKLAFYNLPFLDKLDELLPPAQVKRLEREERISMFPVNFARGMSWAGKTIIFDEAQNSSMKEIVTVLTRVGRGSKCFVLADPMQTDIHKGQGGFETLNKLFGDEESKSRGIHSFTFTEDDIMRSELVKFLIKKINTLGN